MRVRVWRYGWDFFISRMGETVIIYIDRKGAKATKKPGTMILFIRKGQIMLKIYCYSRCTTCKKALKWLDDHGIEYDLTDIKTDHPDEAALRKYYSMSGLPLKRFFNTSGQIYRDLELSKKLPSMSEDEQFALLAADGMLVKRPLLIGEDFVMTGFKEEEWKEKLL